MPFTSYMQDALHEAEAAAQLGEVPVGAVIVHRGAVIARAHNQTRQTPDPTGHAEMIAIRKAAEKLGRERLAECDLYVTLEPCAMCAGAIGHARIRRLYIGASDPKSGGVRHGARVFDHAQTHHSPEIYDSVDEAACAKLLQDFFAAKRA